MESSEGGTGGESFNQKLKRAEDVMIAGSKVRSNEGRVMVGEEVVIPGSVLRPHLSLFYNLSFLSHFLSSKVVPTQASF